MSQHPGLHAVMDRISCNLCKHLSAQSEAAFTVADVAICILAGLQLNKPRAHMPCAPVHEHAFCVQPMIIVRSLAVLGTLQEQLPCMHSGPSQMTQVECQVRTHCLLARKLPKSPSRVPRLWTPLDTPCASRRAALAASLDRGDSNSSGTSSFQVVPPWACRSCSCLYKALRCATSWS